MASARAYYKATRPDGMSFRGGVDYGRAFETGELLVHPERMVRNKPSTYFSVSVEPADCTGMRWPCRLFRVEPVGRVLRNDELPNKRCCSRLRVVEELDGHVALGPNGREVAALIDRAGRLTTSEVKALAAAWDAAWAAAWDAARALVVRDLISKEDFDVLFGPWAEVIGEPTNG